MIQAVILAGGVGSRMGRQCKALLNIEGQPFITRLIDTLARAEVHSPLVLTHEWPLRAPTIQHRNDGQQRLGTGGALLNALPLLHDPFMVLNGDSFVPGVDYRAIVAEYRRVREDGAAGLMVVYPPFPVPQIGDDDPCNTDLVDSRVTAYGKVPQLGDEYGYVDAGIFITSPDKLSQYSEGAIAPFDLGLIYRNMIAAGVLAGYEVQTVPYEVGSPEGLERYRAAVREGRA